MTKGHTDMHSRANQTTAPPRFRVAIVIAFLALCALILGLAAPPPAFADTGQQTVLTTAPPPDLVKIQPVILDTSPPADSAGKSVAGATAVEFAKLSTASVESSLTSGQANHPTTGNIEPQSERLALGPESVALSGISATSNYNQAINTEATCRTKGEVGCGTELATAQSIAFAASVDATHAPYNEGGNRFGAYLATISQIFGAGTTSTNASS